ncbi:class I SAM-dependent methyltransferase [Pelagibacteraceae bacterium]|nr:class I SAM-dependent methyltransferase [Pelagibacteraceae bacterium]
MHKFENSWLFQREKIDNLSKNIFIIKKINSVLKNYDKIRIIDLGTGTGSNFRYLSKKIKFKNQSWTLMDLSKSSLKEAKKTIVANIKIKKIIFKHDDIIKNIQQYNFKYYDLVTGSAFLDIMPVDWFKKFYTQNKNTKLVYFSINYDGYFKFYPKHKLDRRVLQLFNNDQKSKKNNKTRAVGPHCSNIINSFFSKTHKCYLFKSNWTYVKNKNFQLMFLDFCENIIKKNRKTNFSEWLDFRKDNIIKNKSNLSVSNKDFLAIKI